MRDHPIIENMERYGTPCGKPEKKNFCPVCDEEADELYYRRKSKHVLEVVGCYNCIETARAYEVSQ